MKNINKYILFDHLIYLKLIAIFEKVDSALVNNLLRLFKLIFKIYSHNFSTI